MRPLFNRLFGNTRVLHRGAKNFSPSDNTDGALIDSAGGRFTKMQDPLSIKRHVSAERHWPGVGRQHERADWDSDLEDVELQNGHVHVKSTVDITRVEQD